MLCVNAFYTHTGIQIPVLYIIKLSFPQKRLNLIKRCLNSIIFSVYVYTNHFCSTIFKIEVTKHTSIQLDLRVNIPCKILNLNF